MYSGTLVARVDYEGKIIAYDIIKISVDYGTQHISSGNKPLSTDKDNLTPNNNNVNTSHSFRDNNRLDDENVYSYRNNMNDIEKGMKDDERYEILKNSKIKIIDGNNDIEKEMENLTEIKDIDNILNMSPYNNKKIIKKIGEKFGVYKKYHKFEIEFGFSRKTVKEMVGKMEKDPRANEGAIFMIKNTEELLKNAVPIMIRGDKYVDTIREDKELKNVYVMLSAYEKDGFVVPVEIIAKERHNNDNKIYIEVSLNNIEKGNDINNASNSIEQTTSRSFPYEMSVSDVIKCVKSTRTGFLQYLLIFRAVFYWFLGR